MPAPDYLALNDPAPFVERALKAYFAAQVPAIRVFGQRELNPEGVDPETGQATPAKLPAARVDMKFTKGQWSGRWGVDRAGVMRHSCWHYSLQLDVWTNSHPSDPNEHGRMVSIATGLRAQDFTEEFMPFHTLVSVDLQSAEASAEAEKDEYVTVIKFTGLVVICSDAWPILV